MSNIAAYVRQGGAVMLAVGPEYADSFSLFDSPLQEILPAAPTGEVFSDAFRPRLSPAGARHPVTAELTGADAVRPSWGRWLRQVQVAANGGEQLMTGVADNPLLVLNRVGEGRVALLLSDTIWLWGKGFDGGGPQSELLRRIAHWLMKEPELEEETLSAEVRGDDLVVTRRSLTASEVPVTVTDPDGVARTVVPRETAGGRAVATLPAGAPGLYTLNDGTREAVAAVGTPDPLENFDVNATPDRLAPVVEATGGGTYWLADGGTPAIRRITPGRTPHGSTWLGLNANREFVVTGVNLISLVPALLALLAVMAGAMAAWWREGR
ncbi:MAG: hypothetical protein SFV21_07155, partial [Rhodospirillaceae bacterium]|nr:hypothetical protein [Rhodospirillaceae bacterium]